MIFSIHYLQDHFISYAFFPCVKKLKLKSKNWNTKKHKVWYMLGKERRFCIYSSFFDFLQSRYVILCEVPGPIKSGSSEPIVVIYDTSKLKGGQPQLEWTNIEVYSNSPGSKDTNIGNNKGNKTIRCVWNYGIRFHANFSCHINKHTF